MLDKMAANMADKMADIMVFFLENVTFSEKKWQNGHQNVENCGLCYTAESDLFRFFLLKEE